MNLLLWISMSPLERRINKLCRSPEGRQALEDAVTTWHRNRGHWPNDRELAGIVDWVRWQRSPLYWVDAAMLLLFIASAILFAIMDAARH